MSGAYVSGKIINIIIRAYLHPEIEGLHIFTAHDGSDDTKMVGANIATFDRREATIKSQHHRVAQGLMNLSDAVAVVAALLLLPDGRQLVVNPGGRADVAMEGDYTNTNPERRTWNLQQDILSLRAAAVRDGGCLGARSARWR